MIRLPDNERTWCHLWWGGVVLLFSLTYLLAPIRDPDFFWHLHTGQWIWEHRALPISDPLTTWSSGPVDARQYFVLTSYWLAQLVYFVIYLLSGWSGFFLLRAFLLFLLVCALLARRHTWPLGYAIFAACFLVILVPHYPVDRPQWFSFVAFAVVVALLDRLVDEPGRALPRPMIWGFPALMLLWGNLHGGVLIGQILCGVYLLYVTWCYLSGKISRGFFLRVGAVLIGAILLSLVTPNWANYFKVHQESFNPQYAHFSDFNHEYSSLVEIIMNNKGWQYGFFPLVMVLAFYNRYRNGIKNNLLPIFLLSCFSIFAFKHIRFLPFLGIFALPYAADTFASVNKKLGLSLLLALCAVCIFGTSASFGNIRLLTGNGPIASRYPQKAVEFVKQSGLRGNLLNDYVWGGYLGWMLGAGHNIFVDGRTLDLEKHNDWLLMSQVLRLDEQGVEKHIDYFGKDKILGHILRKYKIDYMVLPKTAGGEPFWLSMAVATRRDWKMVYNDPQAVVFVRNDQ